MTNGSEPINAIIETEDAETMSATFYGLTKREYFAAMAMQGLCTHFPELGVPHAPEVVRQSIEIADAFINALNKEREL